MKFIDLTNRKFGMLTVLKRDGHKGKDIQWLCLCECGKNSKVTGYSLISGNTKSCGCLKNKTGVILKDEMTQAIQLRQNTKLSFVKISKILGIGKSSVENWCKSIELKKKKAPAWTKEEIEILKLYYETKGSKYCAKILNRPKGSVLGVARKIGLHSDIVIGDRPKKTIIQKISKDRVVSFCYKHGNTVHTYKDKIIISCLLCQNINAKNQRLNNLDKIRKYNREWRKNKMKNDPIYNLASRLRCQIRDGIRRHIKNKDTITKGCFSRLSYTPKELYCYITNIKNLQNNCCPTCENNYDKVGFNIEHVTPLATAKTEQEIIDLFCLQNLNVMCGSCNSSKNKKDYNTWLEEKKYGN